MAYPTPYPGAGKQEPYGGPPPAAPPAALGAPYQVPVYQEQVPAYAAGPVPVAYGGAPPPYGAAAPYPVGVGHAHHVQPAPGYAPGHAGAPIVVDVGGGSGGPGTGAAYAGDSKYLDELDRSVRAGFIRKVYLILTAQLAVTTAITAAVSFSDPVRRAVEAYPGVLIAAIVLSFGFLIALTCCPGVARKHPTNMLLLGAFTLCESYLVACIAARYTPDSVLLAVGGTAIVTLGLTAFAWQTKVDYTMYSGMIFSACLALLIFGLFVAVAPSAIGRAVYSVLAILLFSFFIVYDTQMIIGGKHHSYRFEVDEYVFAALNLYMDIIQLFLQLLRLFGDRR